jgi:hypothetical protein
LEVSCCCWVVLCRLYNTLLCIDFEEAVQLYEFGHDFQGINFVGQICCCEVFFLVGNYECAVVKYFLEA